jgi:hypothetical protein
MSVAECYVINVQCDGKAHDPKAFVPREQFTGTTKRVAMADLRNCGWYLGANFTAYCRECALGVVSGDGRKG